MSKRVLVLVEGQTEERFVKDVLAPEYYCKDLYIEPTLLVTKKVKNGPNFKGGVTNFQKFENDVNRLLHASNDALVTTLIDYYGLPSDFPGMDSLSEGMEGESCVTYLEEELKKHFSGRRKFLPFLLLHEFEALLFSDITILSQVLTDEAKEAELNVIKEQFSTPEEINNNPRTAPSKRIQCIFPAYKKTLHGPMVAKRIGLEVIRDECPHFSKWLDSLDSFAAS